MKATLKPGQWFMYPIDSGIPSKVWVYEGSVYKRKRVGQINRFQALALRRWHGHPGLYHAYSDRNGNYRDVRVVGDSDAWMGEE